MSELNPALQDIDDILSSRPELTGEEWEIVTKASDWIKATLKPEIRKELENEYEEKYLAFAEQTKLDTQEMVKKSMEEWKAEQAPLSQDELATLLKQEYVEFEAIVKVKGEISIRSFTICELPQEVELKFVKVLQNKLIPLIQDIDSAEWSLDNSTMEQFNGILQQLPSALDAAADLVAVCLDPWGEDNIDSRWVKHNISISRITNIIFAQVEANRYRDFFSKGSRSYRSLKKK